MTCVRSVWSILCAVGALVCGCARSEQSTAPSVREDPTEQRAPEAALDALARAHVAADDAEARGDYARADALLSPWLDEERLRVLGEAAVRDVQRDLWFRRARAALGAGDDATALTYAQKGLALGDADTLFSANLHIALGRAAEHLGRDEQAASAYHRALRIHEALLHEELEGGQP